VTPGTMPARGPETADVGPSMTAGQLVRLLGELPQRLLAVLRDNGERGRAQRDAFMAFGVRIASAGILYFSQVILARWMGSFDYGIYVVAWTWVLVLGGISALGLNHATTRLVPEYREKGQIALLRGILLTSRLVAMGVGTLVAAVGLLALWAFEPYLSNHYVLPAFLMMACVPIYAVTDVQDGIGRGRSWMTVALLPPYILRPAIVLLAMLIAHEAGLPMRATTAAGAAIVASWLAGMIQLVMLERRLAKEVPAGPRDVRLREWFTISLPLMVVTCCEIIIQSADVIAVSRYMTPADAGIYFAAAKTMSLILFVHYAVGSAVSNRFASLHARGDHDGLRAFVKDSVNWTFWPSLAGALVILVLGQPLLWMFGPQFLDGYPAMFVLVLGFLARSAMGPSEFVLRMLGQQRLSAAVYVVTSLLSVILCFTLVPWLGLVGAAAGSAIALVTAAVMNWWVARTRLGLDIGIWSNLPWR